MRGLSSESVGIFVGCEPVARIRCSNCSSVVPPGPATDIDRGPGQRRAPLHERDLPHLRDAADAGGELVDDALLETAELVDVHLRLAVGHAQIARVLRLVDHLGDVEQRLRRNAAAIETDAAGILFLVNERDLHAKVSRIKRSRISARSRTEHYELVVSAISR